LSEDTVKPSLKVWEKNENFIVVQTQQAEENNYLYCDFEDWSKGSSPLLFTENETNYQRLFNSENKSPYVKDGINNYVVQGDKEAINPQQLGTKFAPHYVLNLGAGETKVIKLRLTKSNNLTEPFGQEFDNILQTRKQEADEFYQQLTPFEISSEERNIQRQAFAGMLWTKQFYYYSVKRWLEGDPTQPTPPAARKKGRNHQWRHLDNAEIISMPDKWEYPWYAAWDSAFHALPLALLDPEFTKNQLDLMTREWYMHPNGQLPAYEWAFGDVNPPVHAWATWRVYKIEEKQTGQGDRVFLERVFQKLLLNFT